MAGASQTIITEGTENTGRGQQQGKVLKNSRSMGSRDGSAVKSTDCSFRVDQFPAPIISDGSGYRGSEPTY